MLRKAFIRVSRVIFPAFNLTSFKVNSLLHHIPRCGPPVILIKNYVVIVLGNVRLKSKVLGTK